MTEPDKNKLYFGDNLEVMREYLADESVDLVYLDPPFNSNVSYNVLFEEHDGVEAASQIQAFDDTWRWDQTAAWAYETTIEAGGQLAETLQACRKVVGTSNMLAYLSMMAPRLAELRRILKPTGSIYLHCDPTASHLLRLLLDAVFGPDQFGAEIIWKRSTAHSDTKQGRKRHGRIHDVIYFYAKGPDWYWNPQYTPYDEEYIETFYRHIEPKTGRRYQMGDLTGARPGGDTRYEWRVKRRKRKDAEWQSDLDDEHLSPKRGWEYKGVTPYAKRIWAYSKENMRAFAEEGRIVYTKSGTPRYKRYLDEMPGVPLQDIWTDIRPVGARAAERLGYPTQKPVALLERIIQTSAPEGGVVLDPFCGCGTTIDAAQKLNRRWIGIDVTHLAVGLIRHRLNDTYGDAFEETYEVLGEPTSVPDARVLAEQDPFQFQWWLLGLVGARPIEKKKGADKGIDGRLYFHEGDGKTRQVILSVKAGKPTVSHLRDLRGVVEREEAAIGVLLLMHSPTKPMREEAAAAGMYESTWGKYPRLQILTVAEILEGKGIDRPRITGMDRTYKHAKRRHGDDPDQMMLREAAADYPGE